MLTAKATVRRAARGGRGEGRGPPGTVAPRPAPPGLRRAAGAPLGPRAAGHPRGIAVRAPSMTRPGPLPRRARPPPRPLRRSRPPSRAFGPPTRRRLLRRARASRASRPPLRALRPAHRAAHVCLRAPLANPPVSLCGAGLAPRSSRAPLRVLRPAHSAVPAVPRVRLEWRRGLTWADAGVPRRLLSACQQSRGRRAWPRAPGEGSRRGLRGYRPARRSRPIPAAERGVPGTFRASWVRPELAGRFGLGRGPGPCGTALGRRGCGGGRTARSWTPPCAAGPFPCGGPADFAWFRPEPPFCFIVAGQG